MKKLTFMFIISSLLSLSALHAQDPVIDDPLFPGCGEGNTNEVLDCAEMKMLQFVFSNLKHPDEALKAGIKGDVEAKFLVTTSGDIKNPSIVKGLGHGCDEEVLRIIGMMPKWVPGKENGAAKDMEAFITVKFK